MIEPFYQEDDQTIYHGDCLEVMKEMESESIDMIVTDPPYGMNRVENDGKDYLKIVGPALRKAWTFLKEGGSMFVFVSTGEIVEVANELHQRLKRTFWMYKPADITYPFYGWLLTSEAILWFVKGKKPILEERKPYRHDCYVETRTGLEGVEGHPTVKPLAVIKDFVSRCPPNGLIFDPFLGSGTTLVACKQLGRKGVGIEISEEYCKIAVRRLAQQELL